MRSMGYEKGGKVFRESMLPGMGNKAPQNPEVAKSKAKPKPKPADPDAGIFTADKLPGKAPQNPEVARKRGGKVNCYADGGVTEGPNVNVKDDERERAMAAVRRRMADGDDEKPAVAVKPRSEAKLLPAASGRARENVSQGGTKFRENVAPSGRGAAPGSFRKDVVKPSTEALVDQIPGGVGKYKGPVQRSESEEFGSKAMDTAKKALGPLGAGAGAAGLAVGAKKLYDRYKTGKQLAESTARGAADRARLAAKREAQKKADYDEMMNTTGMGAGMKKGGKVNCYAGGGSVKGAGIAQRGVRKCKVV